MIDVLFRWTRLWLVIAIFSVSACSSSTYVYNRLDFLLPWYMDDYVDLNAEQEAYLDELLVPFLAWHRAQELPVYLTALNRIEDSLNEPLTPAGVGALVTDFESVWLRLQGEGLTQLLNLGARLSDEQIAAFLEALWEQQREFEEEYLERTEAEFYQDNYDNTLDTFQDYIGRLSDVQRQWVRDSSRQLLRSDQVWLQERALWLTQLAVLLERKPGWQQRVRAAISARNDTVSADYQRVYEHNMDAIYQLTAQVLNARSERQSRHLKDKLADIRQDLEALIAQGKTDTAARSD
ncbi:MAG: DUF6279 family lipoprotein [Halioglobus sp.]|nr:DUF6279 family lipoprotein [Halioglobus sp.]